LHNDDDSKEGTSESEEKWERGEGTDGNDKAGESGKDKTIAVMKSAASKHVSNHYENQWDP